MQRKAVTNAPEKSAGLALKHKDQGLTSWPGVWSGPLPQTAQSRSAISRKAPLCVNRPTIQPLHLNAGPPARGAVHSRSRHCKDSGVRPQSSTCGTGREQPPASSLAFAAKKQALATNVTLLRAGRHGAGCREAKLRVQGCCGPAQPQEGPPRPAEPFANISLAAPALKPKDLRLSNSSLKGASGAEKNTQ